MYPCLRHLVCSVIHDTCLLEEASLDSTNRVIFFIKGNLIIVNTSRENLPENVKAILKPLRLIWRIYCVSCRIMLWRHVNRTERWINLLKNSFKTRSEIRFASIFILRFVNGRRAIIKTDVFPHGDSNSLSIFTIHQYVEKIREPRRYRIIHKLRIDDYSFVSSYLTWVRPFSLTLSIENRNVDLRLAKIEISECIPRVTLSAFCFGTDKTDLFSLPKSSLSLSLSLSLFLSFSLFLPFLWVGKVTFVSVYIEREITIAILNQDYYEMREIFYARFVIEKTEKKIYIYIYMYFYLHVFFNLMYILDFYNEFSYN